MRRHATVLFIILTTVLTVAGCGGGGSSPGSFTLSGHVTAADGSGGLEGAVISFNTGGSATADASGAWSRAGFAAGTVTADISMTGCTFRNPSQSLNITGDRTGIDFQVTEFIDDFGNISTGWPDGTYGDYTAYHYDNGLYQVSITAANQAILLPSVVPASQDYTVEVDARLQQADGTHGGAYGLVFNINGDYSGYYIFMANPDAQEYALFRVDVIDVSSGETSLTPVIDWTADGHIGTGINTNHLRVVVSANAVTELRINDSGNLLSDRITMGVLSDRYFAIEAETHADGPDTGTVVFDNFLYTAQTPAGLSRTAMGSPVGHRPRTHRGRSLSR